MCIDHDPLSDILNDIHSSDGAMALKKVEEFFVNRTNGGHAKAIHNFYSASMTKDSTSHDTTGMTVLEYMAHLHKMRRELTSLNKDSKPAEKDCVAVLLKGLPQEFLPLVTSIDTMGLQNLEEVEGKIRGFAADRNLLDLTGSGQRQKGDSPNVFSAEEKKTPVCRNWGRKGCPYGENCKFLHTGVGNIIECKLGNDLADRKHATTAGGEIT